MTRELRHPIVEIEDHDEGLCLRVYAAGSKFGAVEIVLSVAEAETLATDALDAIAFSSPREPSGGERA